MNHLTIERIRELAAMPGEVGYVAAQLLAARKEREEYREVVARQIEDKRRLLAERNEARAVCSLVAGNLAAWADKREEAPESAQEHLDEAMHALVRFRPDGGYGEAASKLRLEMWHGEVYAERDAARAELAEARRQRDSAEADARWLRSVLADHGLPTVLAIAAEQPKPAESRPWWEVFGRERWQARAMHDWPRAGRERHIQAMADEAHKRGLAPNEIGRAVQEAAAELLAEQPKPAGGAS